MDRTERRICLYSSLLITLMMNSAKLLALRENGIMAKYWHFDLAELSFQAACNFAFCYFVLYLNLSDRLFSIYRQRERTIYHLLNAGIALLFCIAASTFQYFCFGLHNFPLVFFTGYFARFGLSATMVTVIVRILLLMRDGRKKDNENQRLKSAYMTAELQVLKEQMNPHFLFNSLSSLSGVIREDPVQAQKYVRELSNVFRYTLVHSRSNLVTLQEELDVLRSFTQLIKMRLEDAFQLDIKVDESYRTRQLPHLSLQPLLENAIKHNAATLARPLKVEIYVLFDHLVVSNNVSEVMVPADSNGIGLANLNERYKIMLNKEIDIERHNELFIVKLPLI